MNTDTFIVTGKSHRVCEDHAHTNERETTGPNKGAIIGSPFMAVADGCSAAPNSQIGAMLLARTARQHLYRDLPWQTVFYGVLTSSIGLARNLGVSAESLRATLMLSISTTHSFQCVMYGDGCIAAQAKDGTWVLITVAFDSKAAYYLGYEMDPRFRSQYLAEFGPTVPVTITRQYFDAEWNVAKTDTFNQFMEMSQPFFFDEFPLDVYRAVALITDGVNSFVEKKKNDTGIEEILIPSAQIIPQLLGFKGIAGSFVQRRGNKAMETFQANGWTNKDDLTYGVMTT